MDHRCFVPAKDETLSLQATVEKTLLEWDVEYNIAEILYDPFQAVHLAQELSSEGLNMQEFQQTSPNLHKMCEGIQGLIKGRNLVFYEDEELRHHILNSKIKESPRGLKITKTTRSRRIDLTVALAMACVRGVEYLQPREQPQMIELGTYYDFGDSYTKSNLRNLFV